MITKILISPFSAIFLELETNILGFFMMCQSFNNPAEKTEQCTHCAFISPGDNDDQEKKPKNFFTAGI